MRALRAAEGVAQAVSLPGHGHDPLHEAADSVGRGGEGVTDGLSEAPRVHRKSDVQVWEDGAGEVGDLGELHVVPGVELLEEPLEPARALGVADVGQDVEGDLELVAPSHEGRGVAARHDVALEHEDGEALLREGGRCREAAKACADDDEIVVLCQSSSSQEG